MQERTKKAKYKPLPTGASHSGVYLEMKKGSRLAAFLISGVVSLIEYSEESVTVLTRKGRVSATGSGITVTVLEERRIELFGRIEEVRLSYAEP